MSYLLENEEELIHKAKDNNEEAYCILKDNYLRFILKIAAEESRKNVILKNCWDDLIQEGMIALKEAINAYQEGREAKFSTFAYLVISRKIKRYSQTYLKIKYYEIDCEDNLVQESMAGYNDNKYKITSETIHYDSERINAYRRELKKLSENERKIIELRFDNKSYNEIAEKLGLNFKQVDYQIRKIKKKLSDGIRV